MRNEHTDEWGRGLQTTTLKQGSEALVKYPSLLDEHDEIIDYDWENPEFCCMGQLCEEHVPGLEREGDAYDGQEGVPPVAALLWLGFPEDEVRMVVDIEEGRDPIAENLGGATLYIDFPAGMTWQGPPEAAWPGGLLVGSEADCAVLNDRNQLTFPQIGDLVRYFGVRLFANPEQDADRDGDL